VLFEGRGYKISYEDILMWMGKCFLCDGNLVKIKYNKKIKYQKKRSKMTEFKKRKDVKEIMYNLKYGSNTVEADLRDAFEEANSLKEFQKLGVSYLNRLKQQCEELIREILRLSEGSKTYIYHIRYLEEFEDKKEIYKSEMLISQDEESLKKERDRLYNEWLESWSNKSDVDKYWNEERRILKSPSSIARCRGEIDIKIMEEMRDG